MSKKNAGADEAAQARADEQARQDRVRQGTQRINTIFDGGTTVGGQLASGATYDPTKTYYNADGSTWTPTAAPASSTPAAGSAGAGAGSGNPFGGGRAFGGGASADLGSGRNGNRGIQLPGRSGQQPQSAADQFAAALKNGLYSTKNTSTGFDDNFFNNRRQAYIDYATPQLDQQNNDANKQLMFALDRGGLLDSSVRGQKLSDLQRLYDTNKQSIADKALSYETSARNSVEDARANLISTLNATGDAQGAANAALARSQALSAPAAYDPLSQLFTDFTNGLGIQAAQERSYAAGGPKPTYNTGLFGNTGRVSVSGG